MSSKDLTFNGRLIQKWGFPKIRGTLFRGPHNKDYSILESIFGDPPILGNDQIVSNYGDYRHQAELKHMGFGQLSTGDVGRDHG